MSTLVHWILRDRDKLLDAILDDGADVSPAAAAASRRLVPRLLLITLVTLSIFGIAMAVVVRSLLSSSVAPDGGAGDLGMLAGLPITYALAFPLALGVCLPSYWFFALQVGYRPSLRRIVTQCLAGQAMTGLFVLGIIPIYAAIAILVPLTSHMPLESVRFIAAVGLALPFIAGLYGVAQLQRWFLKLAATLPVAERGQRPGMAKLLARWAAGLYVVITPILVYRLLDAFGVIDILT